MHCAGVAGVDDSRHETSWYDHRESRLWHKGGKPLSSVGPIPFRRLGAHLSPHHGACLLMTGFQRLCF